MFIDFIQFSIKDFIDILLVAYLLYQSYRLMKDSGSINIFLGILAFIGSCKYWKCVCSAPSSTSW